MKIVRREFRSRWKNYLYQSLLATAVAVAVFWILRAQNLVVIASIASSAFIVFAMPNSITAQPRRLIGGHLTGVLAGFLAGLLAQLNAPSIVIYALAVGLSIFIMVVLDLEHAPASGTALGIAIGGFYPNVVLTVILSCVLLAIAHRFLRRFLIDLT